MADDGDACVPDDNVGGALEEAGVAEAGLTASAAASGSSSSGSSDGPWLFTITRLGYGGCGWVCGGGGA